MKAYSFYFNASDWLSSPAVKLMSKAERGVYINLLALAWQSKQKGTLPSSAEMVRRLAEMNADEWVESGEILLEQFPLSECGTYRFNERLLQEVEKEQTKSEKASASAAKRWHSERNANASDKHANASKNACLGNAQEQVQEQVKKSTNVDVAPSHLALQPLKAENPAKTMALVTTDADDEQHWSVGPLTKPEAFKAICERQGYADIDFEFYRRQALAAAEDGNVRRTIKQWNSWVRNYLNNQTKNGPLLKPGAGGGSLPSQPTPRHLLPPPGKETPGQFIYIDGVPGDQNMDRMKAANFLKHYPAAVVVSLAYPQNPYRSKL